MKKNFLLFLIIVLSVFNASAQSIFADDYAPGVSFAPFGGSVNTLSIDPSTKHSGTASLKIPVTSGYTGGALIAGTGQNLSAFNAVTFWAKNDNAAFKLDAVGFGDNAATKVYACERNGVTLSTTWTKYYIPIPVSSILTAETGLFFFAEGSGEGSYNIWLDDIQLENVGAAIIGTPTAIFTTETQSKEVGQTFGANGPRSTYPVNGVDQGMQTAKPYFTWTSSNTSVATFDGVGTGSALAVGTTSVTAKLGLVNATGVLTVNVTPQANPTTAAPTPTRLPADVKSLFSNAYTNIAVETWSTGWSSSNHSYTELQIAGNDTKKYELFHFAGVEFIGAPVDATVYGFMHIDILCPAAGKSLQIRLVDFNAPNSEATVTKATTQNVWVSYDIPITDFATLTNKSKISQILFLVDAGQTGTFFIDNVYFYKTAGGGGGTPLTTAAPAPPVRLPANVISIFSGAYTDLASTDFNPNWGQTTTVTDTTIAGNLTKKYANFNYQGMQFATPINAAAMTKLHIDIWSANATGVKLFPIVTGQPEQQVTLTIAAGWNSFDIDLTQYTIPLSSIIQIKMESLPFGGTDIYFDNLYFYKPASVTGLTVAAPTPPVRLPADVVSVFSGAYTDVVGTNFFPDWGQTTVVSDTTVAGNVTKKYANINYQGIQFASPLNVAAMTTLHLDLWTPNCTSFDVFLINEGVGEQKVTLTPTLSGWNSFDITLSQYNLIALNNVGQFKLEGRPAGSTVYLDNIYFYRSTSPTVSITSPVNNASFTAPATFPITATATANNSGSVTKVEFFIDAIKVGEVLTSPYSFTAASVLGGAHALTAIATDNDLQTTTSATVNINVDGPSGDGYCGQAFSGDYKYRAETDGAGIVTFTMHPLAPIDGSLYAIIYIKEGSGGFAGYNVTSIGPDFTFSKAIANGTAIQFYYTYQVPSGGERNSSLNPHSYTVGSNCTGVTGIPTVSIVTPADNTSYTEPASISFTTAAADNNGTVSKVDFFAGRNLIGTSTNAPFSFNWTNVPAGNYNIAARVTDNSNLTTYSKLIGVTVNIDNSGGFCGTVPNGDYSYRAETVGGNVIFTFHPLAPIAGSNNAIIYINGAGTTMTPVGTDFRYTQAFANGTPLSIYFTYNTPLEGGERNSSATPHSYTVGTVCTPVLPVTLLSFTAARQPNGSVAINWSTAAEFNNDRFLVERSIDGRSFTTIATVAANTNAAITSNYSALDRVPVNGLNYYRLTQVDKDGKKTVYAVKIVNIKKLNSGISVYPNPVKGNIINIKVADVIDSRLNVQLVSVDGKVIYSGTNVQRGDAIQVKLNAIPTAGVYLLKVGNYAPIKILMN